MKTQIRGKGLVIVGILAMAALQGCSVSSTDKVVKPGAQKGGFMGLSKTAEVTVTQPKVLKKQTGKVIVGSFKVGFVTEGKTSAVAKGGILSGSVSHGRATAITHLTGVAPEDMQKITNEAYKNFVAELQTKGYTVITPEELASEPAYAALQETGEASPQAEIPVNVLGGGKVTYFAPDGMKVIYFIGEKKAAFALSTETIKKAQALSQATGADVLTVNYVVNYAGADTYGGHTMTASVRVGQGLTIVPGSGVTFYHNQDFAPVVALGQAVYSEKEFCTIDKITSKVGKAIGTATNVASALLGGGTRQSEEYNFVADPVAYTEGVTEAAGKANQKLIAKLAETKP